MKKEVKELKKLIEVRDAAKEGYKKKKDLFNWENFKLTESIKQTNTLIEECKETIIQEAFNEYNLTKKKKLFGGIGIQEKNIIEYKDKDAFMWAKKHSLCLKLDNAAFKKIAKSQDIDFVTKNTETRVTFPSEIIIPNEELIENDK